MNVDGMPDPRRPRIFGIGLNKTGTTSLHEALTTLGYQSLHWGGPEIRERVEASLAAGEPLLARLDAEIDAFSDVEALSTNYRLLDEQYPGSAFILTVRPVDEWIESRRRHVARNVVLKEQGCYSGTFLEVDEPAWREHWDRHVDGVRSYFRPSDRFLEWDLTAAPGWGPLCELLTLEPPDVAFPWMNRGHS